MKVKKIYIYITSKEVDDCFVFIARLITESPNTASDKHRISYAALAVRQSSQVNMACVHINCVYQ